MATSLTALDICAILKACNENLVSELAFGQLSVKFEPRLHGRNLLAGVDQPTSGETEVGVAELEFDAPGVPSMTMEGPEYDALKEDVRLAQLMTHDPAAYEQEMIDANLNEQETDAGQEDDGL